MGLRELGYISPNFLTMYNEAEAIRTTDVPITNIISTTVMQIAAVIRTTKKNYNLVQHIDCRYQFEFSLHPSIVLSIVVRIAKIIGMTIMRMANIIGTTVVLIATSLSILMHVT